MFCKMITKFLIFFNTIILSSSNNLYAVMRTRTSFLERYQGYSDVVVIHFKVPEGTLFASFKFMADETQMSIFGCSTRNVSLFMRYGGLPVINPDGSPFPKLFKNITRSKIYNYEFYTDKKDVYINISSPEPGSYMAVTFLSYTDPRFNAITQQGLSPSCYASVEGTLYVEKVEAPLIITENEFLEVVSAINSNRYLKFFVPRLRDRGVLVIQEIFFAEEAENLVIRIAANRPPTDRVFQTKEIFYPNTSSSSVLFFVKPQSWHYMEVKFRNETTNETLVGSSALRFRLLFLSNVLVDDTPTYRLMDNETMETNESLRNFYNGNLTNVIPYVQYDLLREASTESFVFSYELVKEMDSNRAIPINMTNRHFSLLKFDVREGSDIGGTLQFIIAYKPKVRSKTVVASEPADHVIVACIRRGGMEIPTWPDSCVFNGVERPAQLVLNKTVDNSSVLVPFPESGTWYATFKLFCGKCEPCNCTQDCQVQYEECIRLCGTECVNAENCTDCLDGCRRKVLQSESCEGCDCDGPCMRNDEVTCNSSVVFDISSTPCVMGRCSENGKCMFMVSDGVVFSTCVCSNRYRGWTCSDGSLATPFYMVVLELVLLVLSNLMFLPAVYIAFRRKYYIEAITYFAICFFSTFYHACDAGENLINYCLVRWSALQFADFFCALLAIWVTIIAVADLPPLPTSICHMLGAIILAFCTSIDRTALWIFAFPVLLGLGIWGVSWYLKYRKIRQRFVNKRYIYLNLPVGVLSVGVGLILYAFLQTESNYKYLHSLWHMIMAVAIIIILPKRDTFLPDMLL